MFISGFNDLYYGICGSGFSRDDLYELLLAT